MLFRTHLVVFIFGVLLLIDVIKNPWFILFGFVGTLLPDLDSYNSKIGKHFISRVLVAFTKHRGIMHSLFFAVFLCLILFYFFQFIAFGFLFGYVLHLFLDCLTRQGIKLFWPFNLRVRWFLRTGGRIESFIFVLIGILDLVLILLNIYDKLL